MKTLAFMIGLFITAVGAIGIFMPSSLLWIAVHFTTGAAWYWYALASVRAAFGVLLLLVARTSRLPTTLRVVAIIPLGAALAMPFVGVENARATIEWWSVLESGYIRLSAVPLLVLGSIVAYACAPD